MTPAELWLSRLDEIGLIPATKELVLAVLSEQPATATDLKALRAEVNDFMKVAKDNQKRLDALEKDKPPK